MSEVIGYEARREEATSGYCNCRDMTSWKTALIFDTNMSTVKTPTVPS